MKKLKKLNGNKKGIQTILAALLMVVIVVVASVMVYAWSTGLLGSLLVTPQTGKEALNMDTYSFPATTTVAISIRNTGTASITLQTYYVKDNSANTWSLTTWAAGPSIAPNAVNPTNVDIGATCGTCTYSGTSGAFATFTAGNSYTVTVVTTRNNQFVFTVVR